MFTGIVEELGTVQAHARRTRAARGSRSRRRRCSTTRRIGASIAVNGCCLTVVELGDGWWAADAVTETLSRTEPRRHSRVGDPVNLERPVRLQDRLGGHLVQGHVDGVGGGPPRAPARRLDPGAVLAPDAAHALRRREGLDHRRRHQPDGGGVAQDGFDVAVIPHTLAVTTLGHEATRRSGEPGGRRAREVRRTFTGQSRRLRNPRCRSHHIEKPSRPSPAVRSSIVVDDEDRENEGDLIVAAEKMTPETMTFMIRHTSGVICMPMLGERLDELQLPLMVSNNTESQRTAFTVSVDARHGTTTGISAADRCHDRRTPCIRRRHAADDFVRPGHIFPLRYREGGVLKRAGHTEAAVDLARLAGLSRPRVCSPRWSTTTARWRGCPQLEAFAAEHGLAADHDRGSHPLPPSPREAGAPRVRGAHPDGHGEFTALRVREPARRRGAHGVRARRGVGPGRTCSSGCTPSA